MARTKHRDIADNIVSDNTVETVDIINGSVTAPKLAAGAVDSAGKIGDNAITTAKILAGNITSSKLAEGVIDSAGKLGDNVVTSAKILDGSISSTKIASGAIDSAGLIADNVVTTAKIVDNNITTAKIADNNITSAKILDGSISSTKIAAGAIDSGGLLADNIIEATQLNVSGSGTAGQLLRSNGDGTFTWVNSPEPFQATTVSGTTHTLDLSSANYFNGGTTTGNTTLAFSNVPTAKTWSYDITIGQSYDGVGNIITSNNGSTSKLHDSADTAIAGVTFKPDGTKMFTVGIINDRIYGWSLSTAWDVSTATLDGSVSTGASVTNPTGNLFIDSTGTHATLGDNNLDPIHNKFTFSTPWDISTLSYTATATPSRIAVQSYFTTTKGDGTAYFALEGSASTGSVNYIREFPLSTPWDVTTYGTPTNYDISAFAGAHGLTNSSTVANLGFRTNGSVLYISELISLNAYFHMWNLATAWDLSSTMTYVGSINVTNLMPNSEYFNATIWDGASSDNYKYVCFSVGKFSASQENPILMIDAATLATHTLTYPASVQNPTDIISTMDYQDKYKLEFITTDGGTTVWKTGHNKYQDN